MIKNCLILNQILIIYQICYDLAPLKLSPPSLIILLQYFSFFWIYQLNLNLEVHFKLIPYPHQSRNSRVQ